MTVSAHLRFTRLIAMLFAVIVAASACSASTDVAASTSAAAESAAASTGQQANDPVEETTVGEAPTDTAAAAPADADTADDAEWLGPDWLVLPAGIDVNYSLAPGSGQDAFVQGEIAAEVTSADAVAHVRQQLVDQGFTFINDTAEWVVGLSPQGEFVQVGASGFDTRTLAVTFFTAEGAERAGLVATLDSILVTLNGETFELQGQCSEAAEGFTGSLGGSFVSINGDPSDYSIFLTITDPDGIEWSGLGGSLLDISPAGFTMTSSLTDGTAAFTETTIVATCD